MSKFKEREKELTPVRLKFCKERIESMGYEIKAEDQTSIIFEYKGENVRLFPYTGWFTGKTVKDGRGLRKLINQIIP